MPKALSFTVGTTSYVDFGASTQQALNLGSTYNIKVKGEFPAQTGWGTILAKEVWNSNTGWMLYRTSNTTIKFKYGSNEIWFDFSFPATPVTLEIDCNGTDVRLLIDGVLKKTNPATAIPSSTVNVFMGARHDNSGANTPSDHLNGTIYSATIISGGVTIADYQLEEGSGTTTADSSSTGATGTIYRAAWVDEVLQSTNHSVNGIINAGSASTTNARKVITVTGSALSQTVLAASTSQANKAVIQGSAASTSDVVAQVNTISNVINVIRSFSDVRSHILFSGDLDSNISIIIKIPYGSNSFNVPFEGKTAIWGEVIPIQEDVESSLKCSFLDSAGKSIFTETLVLGEKEPIYDFLIEYERPSNSTVLKVDLINLTATEINYATLDNVSIDPIDPIDPDEPGEPPGDGETPYKEIISWTYFVDGSKRKIKAGKVKAEGSWKNVTSAYVKIRGVWRPLIRTVYPIKGVINSRASINVTAEGKYFVRNTIASMSDSYNNASRVMEAPNNMIGSKSDSYSNALRVFVVTNTIVSTSNSDNNATHIQV